jgi:quercetin dioxygenase-like cupin family protein
MAIPNSARPFAHLIDPDNAEILDVMGPPIQLLTEPEDREYSLCIMRGTIPPNVSIPLHSHPDPETFFHVSGELEALIHHDGGFEWVRLGAGDIFHVLEGAEHAFRNTRTERAVSIIVSTPKMGRFFREIGTQVPEGSPPSPPSEERIRQFLAVAEGYGYWNATPEENARVGVPLPFR